VNGAVNGKVKFNGHQHHYRIGLHDSSSNLHTIKKIDESKYEIVPPNQEMLKVMNQEPKRLSDTTIDTEKKKDSRTTKKLAVATDVVNYDVQTVDTPILDIMCLWTATAQSESGGTQVYPRL
jgi:hypothetical protein